MHIRESNYAGRAAQARPCAGGLRLLHRTVAARDFSGRAEIALVMTVWIVRPGIAARTCRLFGLRAPVATRLTTIGTWGRNSYLLNVHRMADRNVCPTRLAYFFGQSGSNCLALS